MRKHIWLLCCILLLILVGCTQEPQGSSSAPTIIPGTVPTSPETQPQAPDPAPTFSPEGNFHNKDILVELRTETNAQIYYTTDGSEPDRSSTLYDGSGIPIFWSRTNLLQAHTIKAKAFYEDGTESPVAVHTYFCIKKVDQRFTTAIFSISADPALLTEGPDGIFYGQNYTLRGDASERPVYLQAWNTDGELILSQACGVRIYGGASRGNAVKSMKLYARKRYDPSQGKFDIDLFSTPVENSSDAVIGEYDKLVLRNAGNDYGYAHIRDELCHTLAMDAGFTDYEAVVPAVCFLNGEYYGLFWLHESYCDDYFKEKYPNKYAEGDFEVIEGSDMEKETDPDGGKEVYAKEFNALYQEFVDADLTDDQVFNRFCKKIDVENYLDYFAFNIFINNKDWPQNNFKCYRYCGADASRFTGVYDGRWRFLLHDMDYSFWLYQEDVVAASYNNLEEILTPGTLRYSPLFSNLMNRKDCRDYFRAKIQELAEGALSADNVFSRLSALDQARAAEYDIFRKVLGKDENHMAHQLNVISSFARVRCNYMLKFVDVVFSRYDT